jgi:glycosyltransferase involved in cell wall biosynthesis
MKLLLIVPLPPPITGHSVASSTLFDGIRDRHETAVVNLSVGSLNDGRVTPRRIREVGKVLFAAWRRRRWADAIYLTISESPAGNLKDLFIYLLCIGRLDRVIVHLHGGTIGRELFDRHPWWRRINALFIKRLRGVVISGRSHVGIFAGMIDRNRIHVVPNSAEDELFVGEPDILAKFADARPLKVLYLSGMTTEKGYLDLLDAWRKLAPDLRGTIQLDFAGRFDTEAERVMFLDRISGVAGVRYHGVVDLERKRRLFAGAHVFCLPTHMLEGQPITILEAYAAGCAVVTTGQPGIRDVFEDGVNGFEVPARSPTGLAQTLGRAAGDPSRLQEIALANSRRAGESFRTSQFVAALAHVLERRG